MDGKFSNWVDVESSVLQETVIGPMDFLVFINDLPQNLISRVKLFPDDCIVFRKIAGQRMLTCYKKIWMHSLFGSQNGTWISTLKNAAT